ncbi:MAG: Ldh family oxidoreductase [Acidobacteria bacterium]|nr:Ldh family oxidoreductase [Acidobacteriota bacterium]
MVRFSPEYLTGLAAQLAEKAGVSASDARIFARSLVDADVHGTSTHGISRLNIYLQRIEKGLINPAAELSVDRDGGSVLALDAGNGLGQVQAMKALEKMMPLARANGVAAATIRNSQHFGALSYFCNRAADEDMVLLAMTNCEPAMSPAGGVDAFFGTNPIAASFPTNKGFHVKIDLATSIVARGNIIAANKKKQPIPEGWALDRNGDPTTDAQEALLGTVLTMAGHKGYALALMVETFSGVLSGAAIGSNIGSMYKNLDRRQDVGHFFCLFNIAAFMDVNEFKQRMDTTIDQLKGGKRRPGVEEILIPGERSAHTAKLNRERGITVGEETLAELREWCERFDVPFATAEVSA